MSQRDFWKLADKRRVCVQVHTILCEDGETLEVRESIDKKTLSVRIGKEEVELDYLSWEAFCKLRYEVCIKGPTDIEAAMEELT